MPTVNLSALAGAGQQFFDNNGNPLSGGKLYSYAAGTTAPQATYTSVNGVVAHTNPIVLDSAGRVATGEIWVTAGENYKFVLKTSTEITIATWDNITGINGTGIATNAVNVQYDPAGANAVATTVQAKLRQTVSVQDFGAIGDGATNDFTAWSNAIAYCKAQNLTLFAPNTGSSYNIGSALNIDCAFEAGNYRVFSGAGAITIASGCVDVIYSAWFNNDAPASTIFATGNVPNWVKLDTGIEHKIRDDTPDATTYQTRTFVSGAGVDGDDVGVGAYRIDVADSQAVLDDPSKAGILYGIVITIDPVVERNDVPNDDATGLLIQNGGTQRATDAIYIGRNAGLSALDWSTVLASDAWVSTALALQGYMDKYAIDMALGNFDVAAAAIRLPNNIPVVARNAANTVDVVILKLALDDVLQLGEGGSTGSAVKIANNGGGYLKFEVSSNATSLSTITFANTLQIGGAFRQAPVAVASLPSASIAGAGARYFVSDSSVTTFVSVVAGGGASPVPVYSDGTNWRVG